MPGPGESAGPPEPGPAKKGLVAAHIRRGQVAWMAIKVVRATGRLALIALEVVLALVVLFEEWGWQPLAAAIAGLARFRLVARLEATIAGLGPWPALAVFLVPSALFLPLKLAALWLIAGGYVIWAALLFAFAKVAGTALYARIFQLTQPSLMQLAWFAAAYNWFIVWKEALVERARSTPAWRAAKRLAGGLRTLTAAARQQLSPVVREVADRVRGFIVRRRG